MLATIWTLRLIEMYSGENPYPKAQPKLEIITIQDLYRQYISGKHTPLSDSMVYAYDSWMNNHFWTRTGTIYFCRRCNEAATLKWFDGDFKVKTFFVHSGEEEWDIPHVGPYESQHVK